MVTELFINLYIIIDKKKDTQASTVNSIAAVANDDFTTAERK